MTNEEAIVQIENAIIAGSLDDVSCGALKMAIEALNTAEQEKQFFDENAPTVEPVRHAHWVELWFDEEDRLFRELPSDYKCSICGGIVPRKTFQSGRYCPNCGSKMDEVSE